ncbi:MAG: esterase [Hamadaea sp.]|nr:esterase [Hamadaea sp.]
MREWSLIEGIVPGVVTIIGALALVFLVARAERRWWLIKVPLAAVLSAALVIGGAYAVTNLFQLFPDALPREVMIWIGVALFGIFLAVLRFPDIGWWNRIAGLVAAAIVVVAAGAQINAYYAQYPTLGSLLGADKPQLTDFSTVDGRAARVVAVPPGKYLADVWNPPAGLPAAGTVSAVAIPGTASGFTAREALVYLPPAYHATPRPELPVLVLLPGQPGSPDDWFGPGQLTKALDTYAAAHRGLAPVAVVADPLGTEFANTLCVDSPRGNAETYLATDVPAWISAQLQVTADRTGWGIGGYSFGGTCALQLAVRRPGVYPTFIDLSGQREPSLGSHRKTVDEAFGGDEAAFAAVNPLDILKTTKLPQVAGFIAVGDHDTVYRPQQQEVYAACQAAGLQVQYHELPGAHSMGVWRPALVESLPWFAARARLASS